jgi:hypothetical protein
MLHLFWSIFIFSFEFFIFSAYDEPYLVALLNETIEVRSMQPSLLVQQIQIPGAQLICRSSSGVLYVLAGRQVFRVQSIPVDKQIKMLLEEKQFQLAVKLCVRIGRHLLLKAVVLRLNNV